MWVTAPEYVTEGTDPYAEFTIRRTTSYRQAITVPYNLTGTAVNGTDYSGLTGSATIPAGQDRYVARASIANDTTREWTETIKMDLQPGQGYELDAPPYITATTEIVDNDGVTLTLGKTIFQTNNDDDNTNYVPDKEESGPVSGENDLVSLGLAFPQDVKQDAQVTLFASTERVSIWKDQTKSQLLLGYPNVGKTCSSGRTRSRPSSGSRGWRVARRWTTSPSSSKRPTPLPLRLRSTRPAAARRRRRRGCRSVSSTRART